MNKCKQCGYRWESRKDKPISCPNCKRYDWDNDKKQNKERIIREVQSG